MYCIWQSLIFIWLQFHYYLIPTKFSRSEISSDSGPFGLTLFLRLLPLKNNGGEPENNLKIHSLFKQLRVALEDPQYLSNLIKTHLLGNTHLVELSMIPDPELANKEQQEEQKKLEEINKTLSEDEKKHYLQKAQELEAFQKAG